MRTLLIDGDVMVYQMAYRSQRVASFPHGRYGHPVHTRYAKEGEAIIELDKFIDELMERLDANKVEIALSDVDANFRKDLFPAYKANRTGMERPLLFYRLREYMLEEHDALVLSKLEGDDVLGLWATCPTLAETETIMCSIDKDMRTVPGQHYNWERQELGVEIVTEDEADRAHLFQTLTGDSTDGYPGCPGIGPVKANRLLDEEVSWATVIRAYEKAKLTEEDALLQARLAHILRYGEYSQGEVTLWEPRS